MLWFQTEKLNRAWTLLFEPLRLELSRRCRCLDSSNLGFSWGRWGHDKARLLGHIRRRRWLISSGVNGMWVGMWGYLVGIDILHGSLFLLEKEVFKSRLWDESDCVRVEEDRFRSWDCFPEFLRKKPQFFVRNLSFQRIVWWWRKRSLSL